MRARLLLLALMSAFIGTGCSDDTHNPAIADAIKRIDKGKLRAHVETLTQAGARSPNHREATNHAVDYIESMLSEYGYQPISEPLGSHTFVNIIAERPGTENPSRVLELGAHYDTVLHSPGADDNTSGVAAILEIARVLSTVKTKWTVRFCFFALEEYGLEGSYYHVKQLRRKNEKLDGAIIFEMIGYATEQPDTQMTPVRIPMLFSPPTTGNFIAVIGNFRSGGLGNRFENAARNYVPELPFFSANRVGGFFKDALRSDHKPYWDNGYRAIMLTDTANFRNPNYHEPSDVTDTLNFDFLYRVTQATTATLLTWDRQ